MKSILPLLALFFLASCTTAYKSGQTPDDVYFSPEREQGIYVRADENSSYRRYDFRNRTENYYEMQNDRYLRMRVADRNRWSYVDDYYRNPYAYNYYSNHHYYNNTYWNARNYWNYYYNPYLTPVIVMNPKSSVPNRPRMFNLHVFDSPETSSKNPKMPANRYREYNTPSNQRSVDNSRNRGNEMRDVFGSRGNNSSSNSNSSEGTKSSSNNSGSKSSESKGSNTPVRKF